MTLQCAKSPTYLVNIFMIYTIVENDISNTLSAYTNIVPVIKHSRISILCIKYIHCLIDAKNEVINNIITDTY